MTDFEWFFIQCFMGLFLWSSCQYPPKNPVASKSLAPEAETETKPSRPKSRKPIVQEVRRVEMMKTANEFSRNQLSGAIDGFGRRDLYAFVQKREGIEITRFRETRMDLGIIETRNRKKWSCGGERQIDFHVATAGWVHTNLAVFWISFVEDRMLKVAHSFSDDSMSIPLAFEESPIYPGVIQKNANLEHFSYVPHDSSREQKFDLLLYQVKGPAGQPQTKTIVKSKIAEISAPVLIRAAARMGQMEWESHLLSLEKADKGGMLAVHRVIKDGAVTIETKSEVLRGLEILPPYSLSTRVIPSGEATIAFVARRQGDRAIVVMRVHFPSPIDASEPEIEMTKLSMQHQDAIAAHVDFYVTTRRAVMCNVFTVNEKRQLFSSNPDDPSRFMLRPKVEENYSFPILMSREAFYEIRVNEELQAFAVSIPDMKK